MFLHFTIKFFCVQLLHPGDQTAMSFQHDEVSLLSAPALINSNNEPKKKKKGECQKAPKQCNNCNKFVLHLSKHKNACFKKKPYVCESCGSRFSQKSNLNRHVSCKHAENYVRCQYCNRTWKRKDKLKKHIEISHVFNKQSQFRESFENTMNAGNMC